MSNLYMVLRQSNASIPNTIAPHAMRRATIEYFRMVCEIWTFEHHKY